MIDETKFGLKRYLHNFEGTGGRLKEKPEWFRVEEIDEAGTLVTKKTRIDEQGGMYLNLLVHKIGYSHDRMVSILSKFFKVAEDQISTGGIKDKNAETFQEVSVFNPRSNSNFSDTVVVPHFTIRPLGFKKSGLKRGHIKGNHFLIRYRPTNLSKDIAEIESQLQSRGTLNYYGHQRFGSVRPITAEFGYHILKKDFKKAVDVFLGGKSLAPDDEYRKIWRETQDPEKLLIEWATMPDLERRIVEGLIKRPGDFRYAFSRLPPFLQNLGPSAFRSLLWNDYLNRRPDEILMRGERMAEGNIEIALPSRVWKTPLNKIWEEVFRVHEVDIKMLRHFVHTSRFLFLHPKRLNITNKDGIMECRFSLPTGCYATVLMREIIRDPRITTYGAY